MGPMFFGTYLLTLHRCVQRIKCGMGLNAIFYRTSVQLGKTKLLEKKSKGFIHYPLGKLKIFALGSSIYSSSHWNLGPLFDSFQCHCAIFIHAYLLTLLGGTVTKVPTSSDFHPLCNFHECHYTFRNFHPFSHFPYMPSSHVSHRVFTLSLGLL
jgi:hypothetical protein